jgi:hypothetical protein
MIASLLDGNGNAGERIGEGGDHNVQRWLRRVPDPRRLVESVVLPTVSRLSAHSAAAQSLLEDIAQALQQPPVPSGSGIK